MEALALIEHRQHHELGRRRKKDPISGWRTIDVHAWVCTCGHRTKQYARPSQALRARDAHALDGQLSLDV